MTNKQSAYLDELVTKHRHMMVQLTYRRTGDEQLAKDLVQECFLVACDRIDVLYQHPKPTAWLYDVLNKLTMRELHRAYHALEVPFDDNLSKRAFEDKISMRDLLPSGLTEKEREVLVWRFEKEYSFEQISKLRGISEDASRQQVSRAVRKCRELMKREKFESGYTSQ